MSNAIIHVTGNLTKDPEIKQVGLTNVCNFTIASNTSTKKQDGTYEANDYDCSVWGESGSYVFSKITKGTEVTVCGEFQAIEKPDANGVNHIRLRVKVFDLKVGRGSREAQARKAAETSSVESTAIGDLPTEDIAC